MDDVDPATPGRLDELHRQLAEAEARADRAEREAGELRRQLTGAQRPAAVRPAGIPFWDVLEPTEREVIRSVASIRTFAAGATIMRQGEAADHVIVILGGRASIRVNDEGQEHVLAERGRGQLIGERAALQVSIRSATVVALEMIWALVVRTRDFATFISANPRILAFVEDQRRDRGIDEPEEPAGRPAYHADETGTGRPSGWPSGSRQSLSGENCTVIITDVVAFGAHKRTDEDRLIIREALASMTQSALQGLPGVHSEDRGDGILIVIPPNISTSRVMDQLLHVLPSALNQHNSTQRNPAQIQLRLSVNVGPVVSDAIGVSGEAIIVAARLVEAAAFKEAFVGSTARLGIIVSQLVYDTVIRHSREQGYAASYSAVSIEVKESRGTAWMKLIG